MNRKGRELNSRRRFTLAVSKAKSLLKKFPEVNVAYIYGSFLTRKDYEDVDIALLLSEKSKNKWDSIATKVACKLEKLFKKECDVHILQEMPDHLKYRIISTGKPILVRNRIYQIRFEAKVLSDFLDYKPTYDWHNERILDRLAYGNNR